MLPTAFLVPPLNLLPVCLAGALIARRHRRAGVAILALGLGGLLLLATPLVSQSLLVSLERDLPLTPPPDDPPQAIVILSAELVRSAGTAASTVGPLTLERERAGAALARRTGLPVLVSGGPAEDAGDTLAAAMARSLAEDFATPVRWQEPNSADTWENAVDSAALLHAEGIHSVYLVTHAWHMRRALGAFTQAGLQATAAPVRLDPPPHLRAEALVPRVSAWMVSYYALHEWIGGARDALR